MTSTIPAARCRPCDGVGMCALVAPDLVTLDRWGPRCRAAPARPSCGRPELQRAPARTGPCARRGLSAQASGALVQRTWPRSTTLPAAVTKAWR